MAFVEFDDKPGAIGVGEGGSENVGPGFVCVVNGGGGSEVIDAQPIVGKVYDVPHGGTGGIITQVQFPCVLRCESNGKVAPMEVPGVVVGTPTEKANVLVPAGLNVSYENRNFNAGLAMSSESLSTLFFPVGMLLSAAITVRQAQFLWLWESPPFASISPSSRVWSGPLNAFGVGQTPSGVPSSTQYQPTPFLVNVVELPKLPNGYAVPVTAATAFVELSDGMKTLQVMFFVTDGVQAQTQTEIGNLGPITFRLSVLGGNQVTW